MQEVETRQSIVDQEHLKLLSLGYVVSGGVSAFFSLFGLMYVFMGVVMSSTLSHLPETPNNSAQGPPPAFVGWIFTIIGLAIFLSALGLAAARFRAAWCVKHHKWRVFCLVIAGIGCLEFPYGTALGIFSFIVLGRESVAQRFAANPPVDTLVQS